MTFSAGPRARPRDDIQIRRGIVPLPMRTSLGSKLAVGERLRICLAMAAVAIPVLAPGCSRGPAPEATQPAEPAKTATGGPSGRFAGYGACLICHRRGVARWAA